MNVLWICTDQQRFDTLGCMGNPWVYTPNLDRLAAEGNAEAIHFPIPLRREHLCAESGLCAEPGLFFIRSISAYLRTASERAGYR